MTNRLVQVLEGNNSPLVSEMRNDRDSSNSSNNVEQNVVYNLLRQNTKNSNNNLSDNGKIERSVSNKTCDDARNNKNGSPLLKVPRPETTRKDSDITNKTANEPNMNRKFSQLKFGPSNINRSRSFAKPRHDKNEKNENKKHRKKCKKHKKHHSHKKMHPNCKTR